MVYLGLQDDDEYAYDQYDDGYSDPGYRGGGYGHDDTESHGGHRVPAAHGGHGDVRPADGDYAEVGARGHPEARPERDVRPTREPAGVAPREYGAEPTVRAVPRDEPPSGVSVPRPAVVRAVPTTAARVHVVEPRGFNDAQEIGDRVKSNQAVILNLQGASRDLQRRLIDFSSGLAYGVGGSMSRVADSVFLLAPTNVELSEEEKERLEARGLYRRG